MSSPGREAAAWLGVWNRYRHVVLAGNTTRLTARGRSFGLAECGVACVPMPVASTRPWCRACTASRVLHGLRRL
ncbi:hypothetical protein [Amycolatopsis methanolica]|uniref:hypothetical protein n=1 Tax=Amycolatopsis methanolica TaxID=1814 RepID=UPI0034446F8B